MQGNRSRLPSFCLSRRERLPYNYSFLHARTEPAAARHDQIGGVTDRFFAIENDGRILIITSNECKKVRETHGFPRVGNGVPTGDWIGVTVGETAGTSA